MHRQGRPDPRRSRRSTGVQRHLPHATNTLRTVRSPAERPRSPRPSTRSIRGSPIPGACAVEAVPYASKQAERRRPGPTNGGTGLPGAEAEGSSAVRERHPRSEQMRDPDAHRRTRGDVGDAERIQVSSSARSLAPPVVDEGDVARLWGGGERRERNTPTKEWWCECERAASWNRVTGDRRADGRAEIERGIGECQNVTARGRKRAQLARQHPGDIAKRDALLDERRRARVEALLPTKDSVTDVRRHPRCLRGRARP